LRRIGTTPVFTLTGFIRPHKPFFRPSMSAKRRSKGGLTDAQKFLWTVSELEAISLNSIFSNRWIGDLKVQDKIGEVAGKVWDELKEKGEESTSAVADALDEPQTKVNMAIGWLAKEGKLDFDTEGRGNLLSLKDNE